MLVRCASRPCGDVFSRYDGPGSGSDGAIQVAVDSLNNIYATGECYDPVTGTDCLTMKYTPLGKQVWMARFAGSCLDWGQAIAVHGRNVYVTGRTE